MAAIREENISMVATVAPLKEVLNHSCALHWSMQNYEFQRYQRECTGSYPGEQTGRAEGIITQKKCRKYTAGGISLIGQQEIGIRGGGGDKAKWYKIEHSKWNGPALQEAASALSCRKAFIGWSADLSALPSECIIITSILSIRPYITFPNRFSRGYGKFAETERKERNNALPTF
jgi:hypothetical protein